jgi:hypothetical protein
MLASPGMLREMVSSLVEEVVKVSSPEKLPVLPQLVKHSLLALLFLSTCLPPISSRHLGAQTYR